MCLEGRLIFGLRHGKHKERVMGDQDGSRGHGLGTLGSRDPSLVLGACGEVGVDQCTGGSLGSKFVGFHRPSGDLALSWDRSERRMPKMTATLRGSKQPRLPKSRGKTVVCFLCYQNHFGNEFPFEEEVGIGRSPSATDFEGEASSLGGNPSAAKFKGNVRGSGCLDSRSEQVCGGRS
jgi:hypothetical protein